MLRGFELLIAGDDRVARYARAAAEKWRELFEQDPHGNAGRWATWLYESQPSFEAICEMDRVLGKEIMAWTGFAVLWDVANGFGERRELAIRLIRAFAESGCSLEVKFDVKAVAALYHLDEDQGVRAALDSM